jgi:hypothetical protein
MLETFCSDSAYMTLKESRLSLATATILCARQGHRDRWSPPPAPRRIQPPQGVSDYLRGLTPLADHDYLSRALKVQQGHIIQVYFNPPRDFGDFGGFNRRTYKQRVGGFVHHAYTIRTPSVHHACTMRTPCVHNPYTMRTQSVHHAMARQGQHRVKGVAEKWLQGAALRGWGPRELFWRYSPGESEPVHELVHKGWNVCKLGVQ